MSDFVRNRSSLYTRTAVILVLLLVWAFVASDRAPASLAAAARAAEPELSSKGKDAKAEHDLSALRVFNRVVLLIKDNYVDPKRIEPRRMLVAALDGVERQVAEFMVDGDEKSSKIRVTINKVSKEFDISGVDTFWRISFALKEIFDFVGKNLSPKEDTREVEYAAVNGMLGTLDPHSVLLKPEYFKEMKLQTKGEFGGLGFVIQMNESILTVVRVIKGTPAWRAGIKSKDQILRIGNESTVNMDLNEAVSRLRGKPGSEVSISVLRNGWTASKGMTLTRAIINVDSVEAKLLDHNVGYIKLKGFQGNTARDMYAELKRLKAESQAKSGKPLSGLVLDLRGNPGGLLEQAIQVSDAFLSSGTIVTTVGYSDRLREVKKAHEEDTDLELPLAVIVNAGSASASEIVAGALKNNNRAVVVGRPTFGKGSVQVLYDFPDESALKLTIAQYLTPGDVSIQEVGITPDVELIPSRVAKDRVDVFAPKKMIGEADLDKHFGNPNSDKVATKREEVVRRDKPLEELRFVRDETPAEKKEAQKALKVKERPDRDDYDVDDMEGTDPDTDEVYEDYQIRFARDLVTAAPFNTRDQMLKVARSFVADRRKVEEEKISKAIEGLGVDWSLPGAATAEASPKAGHVLAEMKPLGSQKVPAGETLAWTVNVQNDGSAPLKRLRAYSESENPYLDRREFLFGSLAPGEKRSWTVNVKLPRDVVSRRDEVTLKFYDETKAKLDDLKGEINVVELPHPSYAYSWQILDRCEKCNGDGIAQPGETVEMAVEVKNVGQGKAFDTIGSLKNKADENISLNKGRFKFGELAPGQSRVGIFEFEVKPEYKGATAELQLALGDEPTDEYVSEKLEVPVGPPGPNASALAATSAVRANVEVPVLAAAGEKAPVIGLLKKGALAPAEARVGDFVRLKLPGNRFGFVPTAKVRETRAPEAKLTAVEPVESRVEPKITLAVDTANGGIVTDSDRFALSGQATDRDGLRDLYIFVNEQKVFYKSEADATGKTIQFAAELPLKAGNNSVLLVAREGTDLLARRLLIVRRRGAGEGSQIAQQGTRRSPDAVGKVPLPLPPEHHAGPAPLGEPRPEAPGEQR